FREIREDLRTNVIRNQCHPIVLAQRVDEPSRGPNDIVVVISKCLTELENYNNCKRRVRWAEIRDGLFDVFVIDLEVLFLETSDRVVVLVRDDDVHSHEIHVDRERPAALPWSIFRRSRPDLFISCGGRRSAGPGIFVWTLGKYKTRCQRQTGDECGDYA